MHTREQLLRANWLKLLWSIREEDLQELQGTDLVLYMKFLKYMSYYFLLIMSLTLIFLVPIYVTGRASPDYKTSDFTALTAINVTGTTDRLWAAFLLVVSVSLLGFYLVHRYQVVSMKLKLKGQPSRTKISEKDIALHTVFVKGFPRDVNHLEAQRELEGIMHDSFRDRQVVGVKVIGHFGAVR